ncbi:MAG: TetR/AcrR family transcriptional regulator [Pseudomonadota bacterium]
MAKKQPTRERILDVAQALFNERRYGSVTTAGLATEVGIAEGNLWYHFNDRKSLLEALFERFETTVTRRLELQPSSESAIADYVRYFSAMAEELSTFRFIYRDQADYGPIVGKLSDRVPGLYRDTASQFRAYFQAMRDQNFLKLTDDRLDLVIVNLLIIFRFYLEFAREAGLPEQEGSGAVRQAFRLHMALFEDNLTSDARDYLFRELSLEYLPDQLL